MLCTIFISFCYGEKQSVIQCPRPYNRDSFTALILFQECLILLKESNILHVGRVKFNIQSRLYMYGYLHLSIFTDMVSKVTIFLFFILSQGLSRDYGIMLNIHFNICSSVKTILWVLFMLTFWNWQELNDLKGKISF